jgi:hypothetical protein
LCARPRLNLINVHLRRAVNHVHHRLQHVGRGAAGLGLRVGFLVPHTEAYRVHAAWDDEGYRVLEAWLCAQQGKDIVLKGPGKRPNTRRFQLHTPRTSLHVSLLGSEDGVCAESLSSCR